MDISLLSWGFLASCCLFLFFLLRFLFKRYKDWFNITAVKPTTSDEEEKSSTPRQVRQVANSVSNNADDDNLIDIVNTLQNKLAASGHPLDISLPQIVAIGGQSAGKSSVLERFVGKEFLPRGSRLVTRRPLVIQLIPSDDEYGVFLHKPDVKYRDYNAIKQEIIDETDRECGPLNFSKNPINLTLHSPRVLKLTVVDLPGIVRVSIDGQPDEVVQVVREIALDHIKKDTTIILAVSQNCQDIADSAALELVKQVDPEGERTIGVLTKLDAGQNDARDVLDNTHLRLKRGWVGVVNRQNAEKGKDMDYIAREERKFFRGSQFYSHMAHRMGIPYLQKKLQKTLRAHIKQCLPKVRQELRMKKVNFERELKEIESIIGDGPDAKQSYIISLLLKFSDDIYTKIMGYSEVVPKDRLTDGAIINFKLHTEVQGILSQDLVPNEREIMKLIPNINGMRNFIPTPSLAVDAVCRSLIDTFKDPLCTSVMCVRHVLQNAIKDSAKLLDGCPSLKHELMYQVNYWVEKECENTKKLLKGYIDTEMSYINLHHPGFDSSACDPVAPPEGPFIVWSNYNGNSPESEKDDAAIIMELLESNEQMQKHAKYVAARSRKYLGIIQIQIKDIAIKYIAYFLVKKVLNSIKHELISTVLGSKNMASVTEDCDEEIRRKEELAKVCAVLQEALDAIESF